MTYIGQTVANMYVREHLVSGCVVIISPKMEKKKKKVSGCIPVSILHHKKLFYLFYYLVYNLSNVLVSIFKYNLLK